MRNVTISIHIILLSFSLTFCKNSDSNPGTRLSNISLFSLEKEKIQILNYKGNIVVLDFWATWCDPCSKAVPVLNAWKRSVDPKQFVFFGINTDQGEEDSKIEKHARKLEMRYQTLLDPEWKLSENYTVEGIPCLLVFGKDGTLVYRQYGLSSSDLPGLLVRSKVWSQE